MIETVCPLCGVPRPKDARQCVCNYTFEYDRLVSPPPKSRPMTGMGPVIAAVAAASAVAGAALFHASATPGDRRPELGLLLIAAGLFGACGGIFDWEFFMASRKARWFVFLLGRTGARFVYAVLGGVIAGIGLGLALP